VGILAGGTVWAYFSDTETAQNNTFTVAELDLTVNGYDHWTETFPIEVKPCQWKLWESDALANVGQADGALSLHINAHDWSGGAHPDAEVDAGDAANDPHIQGYIDVLILFDCPTADRDLILSILQGPPPATDYSDAFSRIQDYDNANGTNLLAYLKFNGELSDAFHCKDKYFNTLLGNGPAHDVDIIVHLQSRPDDDNLMQGDQVLLDKTFKLEQLPCDYQEEGAKPQPLPDYQIQAKLTYSPWYSGGGGLYSYWTVELSGIAEPSGTYAVDNGIKYAGWCVDQARTIGSGQTWDVTLVSTLSPTIYNYAGQWVNDTPAYPTFNYINYLINHYDQSNKGEGDLQRAIWYFLDGWDDDDLIGYPGAQAMVADALANGSAYVPDGSPGNDLALVMLFDGQNFQITGIEVDP
jgi:predicted ribosomally synthesized peptide with SipW-like signal peptide